MPPPRALILVEGLSDKAAVEALARRRGRALDDEGVEVVAVGGAHGLGRALGVTGAVRLAGLCDAGEEPVYRQALERAGLGVGPGRAGLEALGFFVCDADLEDELIRALGAASVERVIEHQGESGPWRTFRRQPAQRGRPVEAQLRRWIGTKRGRKIRYGALLVDALDLARVPRPLELVLAAATPPSAG